MTDQYAKTMLTRSWPIKNGHIYESRPKPEQAAWMDKALEKKDKGMHWSKARNTCIAQYTLRPTYNVIRVWRNGNGGICHSPRHIFGVKLDTL